MSMLKTSIRPPVIEDRRLERLPRSRPGSGRMPVALGEPGASSHAYAAPAPDCDNTVPLNHCGSYMPENDPNNGS